MCGFIGISSDRKIELNKENIEAASTVLSHRGPDESGHYIDEKIAFFHNRLAIIGLVDGQQPMTDASNNYVIIFNGEIYNYRSLKSELESLGYIFQTSSDTEVVLAGYIMFGIKVLERLDGMFAIAIYDKLKEELTLARDRYGEKPLYYTHQNNQLIFGSELKAIFCMDIPKVIDPIGMDFYFSLTYIPAPYSIYKDVYKLEQGNYLIYKDNNYSINTYYSLKDKIKSNEIITDYKECQKILREKVFSAVESRMVSDVPIGAFLSGGIDSSIVVGVMNQINPNMVNTFSIGYELKSFDESDRAIKVSKYNNTNHKQYTLDYESVVGDIDGLILNTDEPFGDSSLIPSYVVSRLAQQDLKVVLTGDAGDELFAGYSKHLIGYYKERYNKIPSAIRKTLIKPIINHMPVTERFRNISRQLKKVANAPDEIFDMRYQLMCLGFIDDHKKLLFKNHSLSNSYVYNTIENHYRAINSDELTRTLYTDLKVVLEGDMLCKVDRASMFASLETRVPFLDPSLVEFSYQIPSAYKIQGKDLKHIFKDTFKDLLPDGILNAPKRGFGVPVGEWLRNELREELEVLLAQEFIIEQGLFEYSYIKELLDGHISKREDYSFQLWILFVFQKWYRMNIV